MAERVEHRGRGGAALRRYFLYRLSISRALRQLTERARELKEPVIFDTDDLIFEAVWSRNSGRF